MGDKKRDKPGRWAGEEVEEAPPGEAERAADRAEGNAPVPAAAPQRPEAAEDQPEEGRRRAPSHERPDEKISEAAEGHREAEEDHVRLPPHGRI